MKNTATSFGLANLLLVVVVFARAEAAMRKSQLVELRFFGGLSVQETAEVLQVSPDTAVRDWRLAKAWLLSELSQETLDGC